MNKIFAVYKPKGPSSYDIIRRIKNKYPGEKIGHAGTLDPLASGVLVVGVGREATRRLKDAVGAEKEYIALIKLGETSTTDDAEGEKKAVDAKKNPDKSNIERVLKNYKEKIKQIPPDFSAVKIDGERAYKKARRREAIEPKAREVEIKKIEVLEYRWPYLKLRVLTGPGFYVRSLARDIGKDLGTGGYLADLERTRVGEFTVAKAETT